MVYIKAFSVVEKAILFYRFLGAALFEPPWPVTPLFLPGTGFIGWINGGGGILG